VGNGAVSAAATASSGGPTAARRASNGYASASAASPDDQHAPAQLHRLRSVGTWSAPLHRLRTRLPAGQASTPPRPVRRRGRAQAPRPRRRRPPRHRRRLVPRVGTPAGPAVRRPDRRPRQGSGSRRPPRWQAGRPLPQLQRRPLRPPGPPRAGCARGSPPLGGTQRPRAHRSRRYTLPAPTRATIRVRWPREAASTGRNFRAGP
jgi:hypothetical protein